MALKSGLVRSDNRGLARVGWWRGNGCARMLIALVAMISRELKIYMLVTKDDRTPRASKILLWTAVVYAISPIGLVPDFIPIVGYVDDAIIVPILVFIAVRRVPREVLTECRSRVISLAAESS